MLLSPLPAVEVSLKQCTPTAGRFEGFAEEDFAEWLSAIVLLSTGFQRFFRVKNSCCCIFQHDISEFLLMGGVFSCREKVLRS
ncbi:TPA: hypothetical protein ACHTCC_000187 [Citrobacter freundii]